LMLQQRSLKHRVTLQMDVVLGMQLYCDRQSRVGELWMIKDDGVASNNIRISPFQMLGFGI
jgi:hypothetical protein